MDEFSFFQSKSANSTIIAIKTLRESIYSCLRDAIFKQQIKPGERLHEKEIAKQFGVSTTPVREAFLKLQSEGYIDINSHRSVKVKPISHSELIEIYQVISVLDGFASKLAIKRTNQSFLKKLQDLTNEMESFYKKDMVEEYLKINTFIHSLIWEKSGNIYLKVVLNNIQNQMLRYQKERLSFYSKKNIIKKSIESHKRILKLFKAFDNKNIERIVRDHWNISGIIPEEV